jgi:anti-anti-sigma factor
VSFDCTIERDGDLITVVPAGDIDWQNVSLLREVLRQVVDRREAGRIDVDMRDVTFLDSSGIGMFVAAQRAAAAKGSVLMLREPGPVVRLVLEVTNLEDQLVAGPAAS